MDPQDEQDKKVQSESSSSMPKSFLYRPQFDPPAGQCVVCGGAIFHWGSKTRSGVTYHYDRCKSCDFAFVNPRPAAAVLADYYRSAGDEAPLAELSQNTATVTLADLPVTDQSIERIIRRMMQAGPSDSGSGDLLDVGAGGGSYTVAALRCGLAVTCLELDPRDVASLQRLPVASVITTPFEEYRIIPRSFDYVLMSHVLEHAHDPSEWVRRASLLLRPGGVLAVMLPHFNSIYRLIAGTKDRYFFPPEHLNHFNAASLSTLANRHGLPPVSHYTEGRFGDDIITRRLPWVPLPGLVRRLTGLAGLTVESLTRATGTGAVLVFFARKPLDAAAKS
jgi:SAM-dependent methyltransferase